MTQTQTNTATDADTDTQSDPDSLLGVITRFGACDTGLDWAKSLPEGTTVKEGWFLSERGSDLLWLAGKVGVERKSLVLAACGIAWLALPYVPEGEERPLLAIEAAEGWCKGEVDMETVKNAAFAARATAHIDPAAHNGAADAANAASTAYAVMNAKCADAVREAIPWEMIEAALNKSAKK